MTIFYYFKEMQTPMYQWQRTNFIDELERNGHKIITFNPLNYRNVEEANEKVLIEVGLVKNIDLFMTCDDQDVIYPETISSINQKGIPTCLICWDNLEVPYKQKKIAPLFDIIWLTSRETQYLFEKWGCKNIIYQTYAANPHTYKAYNDGVQINSVGFIGSPYGSRVNVINELILDRIPCRVYSDSLFVKGYNSSINGKKEIDVTDLTVKALRYLKFSIGRKVLYSTIINKLRKNVRLNVDSEYFEKCYSVSDTEMCKLYSEMALSLNISALRDTYILKTPIPKVHLRTFEIPMCGGLQFTQFFPEITEYFENDKEIILFNSREEMIDKAKYYLDPKNESEVKQMKKAARVRAEKDHTWITRFNRVFNSL